MDQVPQAERIAKKLGNATRHPSGWWCNCPLHQTAKSDRPSLKLVDGRTALVVACKAECSVSDILRELRRRDLLDDGKKNDEKEKQATRPVAAGPDPNIAARTKYALKIWDEAVPIPGTLGERYLVGRGLVLPPGTELKFHARCPRGGWHQCAIVLLMRDIKSNEPVGIQRRFLKDDGSKDGVAWSLGRATGAVWKASPDEDVSYGLGLAEGHADALAILASGWAPIWATSGTSGMANFPVLDGIDSLTIFVDADGPGRIAAKKCEMRWLSGGREVAIVPPPRGNKDFGDMVRP